MASLDSAQRRQFLRFVTGTPRLPIGGFAALRPRLTVVKKEVGVLRGGSPDAHLPSCSTCQVALPPSPLECDFAGSSLVVDFCIVILELDIKFRLVFKRKTISCFGFVFSGSFVFSFSMMDILIIHFYICSIKKADGIFHAKSLDFVKYCATKKLFFT